MFLATAATSRAAIISDYLPNANGGWGTATIWSTNPTIPNAIGDTVQRIVAMTGSRTLTQNIAAGVTVGSILYGNNNDLGNFFWRVTIPAGNTLTFNQDGTDPGFATFRNSNTNTGTLNTVFFNITGSVILADDLHVINESGSTNANGAVQLASPVTGAGNITFISNSPISSTDTSSPGSISFHSPNTFVGNSLIQKGLVVAFDSATPFGDAANVVTLGESGQGSAAILSRKNNTPINYAITVAAAAVGETRTFGSAADADYTVSSGNITLDGDLNLRAGTVSTTAVQEYSGIFSGVGSLTKTGTAVASLSGANTYAGTTTISAGKLLVNGTHMGGGAYTVNSGGTLGGNGQTDAVVNVLSGGSVAPGASPGSLTLGGLTLSGAVTGQYEIDAAGGPSDLIELNMGTLNLSGNPNVTINVSVLNGTFLSDGVYNLVHYGNIVLPSGGSFTYNGPLNTLQSYKIDLSSFSGEGFVYLELTTVPEPAGLILLVSMTMVGIVSHRVRNT